MRRHGRQGFSHATGQSLETPDPPTQLPGAEHRDRQHERQQVVDESVGQQCRDPATSGRGRRYEQHHHGLEHAEAPRHLAQETRRLGEQVDGQEVERVDRRAVRKQQPQHGGRHRPVERRHRDLSGDHPRSWRLQDPTTESDRPAGDGTTDRVDHHEPHEHGADRPQGRHRQMQLGWNLTSHDQEHDAAEGEQTEPERESDEPHQARDLDGRQAPARVQTHPQRRTADAAHPHRVGEGVPEERRQCRPLVRDGRAGVSRAQRVVQRQHEIADDGQADGGRQGRGRQGVQLVEHLSGVEIGQLPVKNPESGHEEADPERGQESPDPSEARARTSLSDLRHDRSPLALSPEFRRVDSRNAGGAAGRITDVPARRRRPRLIIVPLERRPA